MSFQFPQKRKLNSLDDMTIYVNEQLTLLEDAFNQGFTTLRLVVRHAAPARPRVGTLAYADGTDWNPGGHGEGLYLYKSGGWTFVK